MTKVNLLIFLNKNSFVLCSRIISSGTKKNWKKNCTARNKQLTFISYLVARTRICTVKESYKSCGRFIVGTHKSATPTISLASNYRSSFINTYLCLKAGHYQCPASLNGIIQFVCRTLYVYDTSTHTPHVDNLDKTSPNR